MASFDSSGWPSGATVTVYARDAFGNATGASVTSATATSAGVASFSGLADSGKYVATDGSRTVKFGTPPASASSESGGPYDVKAHYGAKGDGATDDRAAIQAALDACDAAGGGTVYIPKGTYRVSNTLFYGSKTTVRGAGAASVLQATATNSVLYNKGWQDGVGNVECHVADITVDGNSLAPMGVTFAGVQEGTCHNVRVKNCMNYGIWLWASAEASPAGNQGLPTKHVTVSACHVTNVVDVGIEMDAAQACTVVGNTVHVLSGLAGIYAWNGATDCTVTGNVVEGQGASPAATAFRVSGLSDVTYTRQTARILFAGNVARNVKTGFTCNGGAANNIPTDVVFGENSIHSWDAAAGIGIGLFFCSRVMVRNNHVEGAAKPLAVGDAAVVASSKGTATYITIDGNRFYGGGSSNIYQLTAGSVTGNTWVATTNTPLNLFGCSYLVVNNNRGINCGSGAQVSFLVFQADTGPLECLGNTCVGNHTRDDRGSPWLKHCVLFLNVADWNIAIGNSARGAVAGALGANNAGTGANNVLANNVAA